MEKAHGYTYVRMKQNYKVNGARRQSNSPTSPGDQESLMAASPPSQHHFLQSPMANGFPQLRHQNRYSDQELARLIIHSMENGNTGPREPFTFKGAQGHTNTPGSFTNLGYISHSSTPYPPDITDPGSWDYTPMPVPPENIDPDLMKSGYEWEDRR